MLNALVLVIILGGTSFFGLKIINWDEAKRANSGDTSGHRGKYLVPTKLALCALFGVSALAFGGLVANNSSVDDSDNDESYDYAECTGSMRC